MSKTILVVEDDEEVLNIYREVLTARGYRVLTAVHGAEGVTMARRYRPDLMLMDIRMPVMSGWDAIRYVRADPYTSRIPIWALSAYISEQKEAVELPGRGFDRLVEKPINPTDLLALIEEQVGPP
jgi:two-component system, cell cycle response regulator DivK